MLFRSRKDNVRAVTDKDGLDAASHRHARLARDLDRDGVTTRRVVVNKIQLLVGRHLDDAGSGQGSGQFDIHVTGNARGTVRDGQDRGGRGVRDCLRDVARNRLLQQRAEIGVGRDAPRAGLLARADEIADQLRLDADAVAQAEEKRSQLRAIADQVRAGQGRITELQA